MYRFDDVNVVIHDERDLNTIRIHEVSLKVTWTLDMYFLIILKIIYKYILLIFYRQRQRKKTKQYQRKQKKLFLMAKERKMHIPWYGFSTIFKSFFFEYYIDFFRNCVVSYTIFYVHFSKVSFPKIYSILFIECEMFFLKHVKVSICTTC